MQDAGSLGTQTPRKNGRGVWAPGLPGCISVHWDVDIPVILFLSGVWVQRLGCLVGSEDN